MCNIFITFIVLMFTFFLKLCFVIYITKRGVIISTAIFLIA
ncbi:Uncharacterised protein [Streptococcus pneumoniae]|nr:Uncharacterised protein [Streptococcus pneumoniae]